MTRSKVAVIRTTPETVLQDHQRMFELADGPQSLDPGATTILKDNISWHFPMPSANTTPWQLEGTILALRNNGFKDLVCVQNQTVVTNAYKGEDLNRYVPIFKAYNIPVKFNFEPADMSWVEYKPKARMNVLDQIYPDGINIPDYFPGKNIVHLPTVKCHIYTNTTGAMKNAFGGLLSKNRHYTHSHIHETLVDLLAIQKEIHPGIFAVMDGTTAGNGTGPRVLKPEVKNVLLASADQVAIDAVSAKMMGFDPMSIKYMRMAHDQGLGCADPREIEIVGDVDAAEENWHFEVGHNLHMFMAWLTWFGPTKFLQKLVTHTFIVYIPILFSEAYHDWVHWPFKERFVYDEWMKTTQWGKLWQEYGAKGFVAENSTIEAALPSIQESAD